jgi:hypothetical protein
MKLKLKPGLKVAVASVIVLFSITLGSSKAQAILGENVNFGEVFGVWTDEEVEKFEYYQRQAIEFKRQACEQESLAMKVEEQMDSNSVDNLELSMKKSTDYRNEAESKLDNAHKAGIQALGMFHHAGRLARELKLHIKYRKVPENEIKIIKGELAAVQKRAEAEEDIALVRNLEEKDALKARKEQVSNNWQAAILRVQVAQAARQAIDADIAAQQVARALKETTQASEAAQRQAAILRVQVAQAARQAIDADIAAQQVARALKETTQASEAVRQTMHLLEMMRRQSEPAMAWATEVVTESMKECARRAAQESESFVQKAELYADATEWAMKAGDRNKAVEYSREANLAALEAQARRQEVTRARNAATRATTALDGRFCF